MIDVLLGFALGVVVYALLAGLTVLGGREPVGAGPSPQPPAPTRLPVVSCGLCGRPIGEEDVP